MIMKGYNGCTRGKRIGRMTSGAWWRLAKYMTRKQLELFSVDDMYGCIGVDDEIDAVSVASLMWLTLIRLLWQAKRLRSILVMSFKRVGGGFLMIFFRKPCDGFCRTLWQGDWSCLEDNQRTIRDSTCLVICNIFRFLHTTIMEKYYLCKKKARHGQRE